MTLVVGLGAALAIAAVFAWAGLAKLRRPALTETAFRDLRVPFPGAAARTVPLAEFGIAGLVLFRPRWGSLAAVGMLTAFTVLLSWHVRHQSDVRCGCFGSADSEPVSWVSLVRNGGLIAIAALGAVAGPDVVSSWNADTWAPTIISALSMMSGGALLLSLFQMKQSIGSVFSQAPQATPSGSSV